MFILDTSAEKGGMILAENGQLLRHQPLIGGASLSKTLGSDVKNFLQSNKPDAIAVGKGPGSYTGIRVGVAMAKGLSYGWHIPLIGFCSLFAFVPQKDPTCPVLSDARSGGIYALLNGEPHLLAPEDPRLTTLPKAASLHPATIQKRATLTASLEETDFNPDFLSKLCYTQFLEEGAAPFELSYFSSP